MKDTYRERIKEEQKKLSPSQVFFSEGYRKLFRDLANEVAGEKLEQLLLYQSTEDGLAGMMGNESASTLAISSQAAF